MVVKVGRIVHYRVGTGTCRPAIIVHKYSDTVVNLQVFTDPEEGGGWETSVEEGAIGNHGSNR